MKPDRQRALIAFLARLGLAADGRDLSAVDEALSHTSAGLPRNHERLEFLGDAVLRLAASAYLRRDHPGLSVGQASALRAQLVSDRWLAELAQRCDLAPLLRIGPVAAGDRAGRATLLAECCEALIGAIYETWGGADGGLGAVHIWLDPHWRRDGAELLADPHLHNWKSALQEWSQARGQGLPDYSCEQVSKIHADPRRFHCQVQVDGRGCGDGWGPSRRSAEQEAARMALEQLAPRPAPGP